MEESSQLREGESDGGREGENVLREGKRMNVRERENYFEQATFNNYNCLRDGKTKPKIYTYTCVLHTPS